MLEVYSNICENGSSTVPGGRLTFNPFNGIYSSITCWLNYRIWNSVNTAHNPVCHTYYASTEISECPNLPSNVPVYDCPQKKVQVGEVRLDLRELNPLRFWLKFAIFWKHLLRYFFLEFAKNGHYTTFLRGVLVVTCSKTFVFARLFLSNHSGFVTFALAMGFISRDLWKRRALFQPLGGQEPRRMWFNLKRARNHRKKQLEQWNNFGCFRVYIGGLYYPVIHWL